MPKELTLAVTLPLIEEDLEDYQYPVYIFEAWCKGCEICVALCPKGTLEMGRDKIARVARPETCTSCGLCEVWCPDFCITVLPKKKKSCSGGKPLEMGSQRKIKLLQGNEASAEGAIAAGCRFFAGYPITPSTEVAEVLSERLPQVGGRFIQMEDEIASIGAVIGASAAGVKAMTATSGPGFSLMQENIGYAAMAEVPCVIVNVQRGGPSTGLPTKAHQGDMMQARWGTHGDHPVIALCPYSVREAFDLTVEAFNLSEQYRVPVIVLLDEIIGHMRERVEIPNLSEIEVYERQKPVVPPGEYRHYGPGTSFLGPMASFGQGYRFIVEGLTHNESGYTTNQPEVVAWNMQRLKDKIELNRERLARVCEEECAGAPIVVFAYGSTARSALQAVRDARGEGLKVGFFRPLIVWPFPDEPLTRALADARVVIVPELNQGQMRLEVERVNQGRARIVGIEQVDGEMMAPERILGEIRRAAKR